MNQYKPFLLLLTVFTFMASTSLFCCPSVKEVPEISRSLFDQDVLDLTGKDISSTIFSHQGELVLVATDGIISRWNPEANIINDLYNLNKKVDLTVTPYHQDNFLIMKLVTTKTVTKSAATKYVVFDLKEMKEITLLQDIDAQKIMALDDKTLVYTTPNQQAIIYNYLTGTRLQVLEPSPPVKNKKKIKKLDETEQDKPNQDNTSKTETFLSCQLSNDEILLLSNSHLFLYKQSSNTLSALPLKYPAASGFLKTGKYLYYGSQNRQLVKLAFKSNKVDWHFQIANTLLLPPSLLGKYIVITPEDNNIYFFNKNGTLYWWEQLNSTKRLPIVTMKENAVSFLMDNSLKFCNYKKKKMVTYTLPQWMALRSNPICLGEYIYIVTQDKTDEKTEDMAEQGKDTAENETPIYKRLSKIGNNYTVEINMVPEFIWPKGKSIKFELTNINFIEPRYTVQIFNNSTPKTPDAIKGTPVLSRSFGKKDTPTFVWIPDQSTEYLLLIQIESENKKRITIEKTINTIDINKILQDYYYELQRQFGTPYTFDPGIKKSINETK